MLTYVVCWCIAHVGCQLPSFRISPSLDLFLSRRCHILIDRYLLTSLYMSCFCICISGSSNIGRCQYCRHFPDISTRALAGLIKSVVTAFMRRNLLSLPEGDGTSINTITGDDAATNLEGKDGRQEDEESHAKSLVQSSSEASSCQMYDRLIFLAVPLAVIVKDGSTVTSRSKKASDLESYSAFELGSKTQVLSEIALQDMVLYSLYFLYFPLACD